MNVIKDSGVMELLASARTLMSVGRRVVKMLTTANQIVNASTLLVPTSVNVFQDSFTSTPLFASVTIIELKLSWID